MIKQVKPTINLFRSANFWFTVSYFLTNIEFFNFHIVEFDYEETYSSVVDVITLRYLVSLAVSNKLDMHLMDVVTAYLYGSLDTEIYMKIPEGF